MFRKLVRLGSLGLVGSSPKNKERKAHTKLLNEQARLLGAQRRAAGSPPPPSTYPPPPPPMPEGGYTPF